MYIIALTTHGLTIPVCCARFRYSHDGMLFIFGQLTEPTPRWALGTNPTPPPTDHFFLVNPDGTSISAVARYGSAFKRIESVGELKEEGLYGGRVELCWWHLPLGSEVCAASGEDRSNRCDPAPVPPAHEVRWI